MNRLLISVLLISLLISSSCSEKKKGNTNISGTITNASGQLLMLQELGVQNSTTLDSLTLDTTGVFSFTLQLQEAGLYLLSLPRHSPLVLEVMPGSFVKILGSCKSFPSDVVISGSDNSLALSGFFISTNENRIIYDSLENVLMTHQEDPDFAVLSNKLDESLRPVWEGQKKLETDYITRHPNSLTSLLVLNQGLGVNPLLIYKNDSVYFIRLDSSLNKAFPGNKHALFHHDRIIQERAINAMKQHSE